jgi:hypothetical protein
MTKPAVLRLMVMSAAFALAGARSLSAGSHGSHGSHGGGGHSHGGGSHSGGHSHGGGFHSSGSRGEGGHFGGGGGHFGGSGRGSSGGFFSGRRAGGGGSNLSRGSFRGSGAFSSPQYGSPGTARGFSFGSNRPAMSGHSNSRVSSSAGFRSGLGFARPPRTAASFGPNRPPNSQQRASSPWPGRSGTISSNASAGGRRSSVSDNRPPSAQRNRESAPAMGGPRYGGGTQSARALSTNLNRPGGSGVSFDRASPSRSNGVVGRQMNRASSFGSDRPPYVRANSGNASDRGTSQPTNTSYRAVNRGGFNFGNSRFAGPSFTNTSFSNSNSGRFGGGRSSNFGHGGMQGRGFGYNHSGYSGFGRGRFGYDGFRHRDFGYSGFDRGGGYGGGDDFWFFGDLFGLALDFGRFAFSPWAPLGFVGLDLLNTGIQAIGSLDYNNQQSYNNAQQSYAPLCGTYYSEENPGCVQ